MTWQFIIEKPLTDQLESVTYEVFEKDVTKYFYYQEVSIKSKLQFVDPFWKWWITDKI